MSDPIFRKIPVLLALLAALAIAFILGTLWKKQSPSPQATVSTPDLSGIRSALEVEADRRLDSPLESHALFVTLKPNTLLQAQQALRDLACLPLGESDSESRWLFQGTLEEAKRLEHSLKPVGVVEVTGDLPPNAESILMNITLIGGKP